VRFEPLRALYDGGRGGRGEVHCMGEEMGMVYGGVEVLSHETLELRVGGNVLG